MRLNNKTSEKTKNVISKTCMQPDHPSCHSNIRVQDKHDHLGSVILNGGNGWESLFWGGGHHLVAGSRAILPCEKYLLELNNHLSRYIYI